MASISDQDDNALLFDPEEEQRENMIMSINPIAAAAFEDEDDDPDDEGLLVVVEANPLATRNEPEDAPPHSAALETINPLAVAPSSWPAGKHSVASHLREFHRPAVVLTASDGVGPDDNDGATNRLHFTPGFIISGTASVSEHGHQ